MGYFNYFIKCIIRKFVNTIFKPKGLLIIFLIIFVLYLFGGTARAEWTDTQIQQTIEDLESIAGTTYYSYQQLLEIKTNVEGLPIRLEWMNQELITIRDNISILANTTKNIYTEISAITSQLTTLNTEISNIYNDLQQNHQDLISKLDENQKEILIELEEDNQAVLEELDMIRDAINGTDKELTNYTDLGIIKSNGSDGYTLRAISLNYEPRYTYTIKIYCKNTYNYSKAFRLLTSFYKYSDGFNYLDFQEKSTIMDHIPSSSTNYIINYNVSSSCPTYIYFGWGVEIEKVEVYRSIKGIVESLNDSNSLQQEQNQLQQESNQLQQEQNDFLKDDNVNTNGLEFATDNTVDPTSDGFNTLFSSIYNAFCSTSSKPLSVTLPYINQTFTIQPNLVSNAMQKMRFGHCRQFD